MVNFACWLSIYNLCVNTIASISQGAEMQANARHFHRITNQAFKA